MVWTRYRIALIVGFLGVAGVGLLSGCTDEALRLPAADLDAVRDAALDVPVPQDAPVASGNDSESLPARTTPTASGELAASESRAPAVGAAEPSASLLGENEACKAGNECQSGICEGQGCGEAQLGRCMPAARPCFRDLVPFCGCEGLTFRASSNCPRRRYRARGVCTP